MAFAKAAFASLISSEAPFSSSALFLYTTLSIKNDSKPSVVLPTEPILILLAFTAARRISKLSTATFDGAVMRTRLSGYYLMYSSMPAATVVVFPDPGGP